MDKVNVKYQQCINNTYPPVVLLKGTARKYKHAERKLVCCGCLSQRRFASCAKSFIENTCLLFMLVFEVSPTVLLLRKDYN